MAKPISHSQIAVLAPPKEGKKQMKAGYFKPDSVPCPNSVDGECYNAGNDRSGYPKSPEGRCRMFYCHQCKQSYPACCGGAPDPRCDNCVGKE